MSRKIKKKKKRGGCWPFKRRARPLRQAPPRVASFLGSRRRAWLWFLPPAAALRGRGRPRLPANPRGSRGRAARGRHGAFKASRPEAAAVGNNQGLRGADLPPAMAQWQKVQELGSAHLEQVHQLYHSDLLPMEVRHCLAAWIEDQAWQQAAEPGSSQARMLLYALLAKLDEQYGRCSTEADGFVLQHNLRKAKHDLQARYEECPEELANVIANLLREEKRILSLGLEAQQAGASPTPTPPIETNRQQKIEQRLNEIQESMQDLERSVRHLEELQDTFDFVYKINQAHKRTNPADPELQAQTQQLQAMLNSLDQNRKGVLAKMQTLLGRVETLRDFVLKELAAWRERQRQACLGATHDTALGSLEAWCTGVAGALFQLLRVLRTLQELRAKVSYQHDPLEMEPGLLEHRIREQLTSLLRSAFVVEEQPAMPHPSRRQLVLRTNQKFSTCIRLLVKLQDRNQQLVVKMECDKDPPNVKGFRRFNILTSPNKTLALDERHRKGLVCDFRHVMLKEQKVVGCGKGSKGASEGLLPVTEELHLITFTLDYKYQDVELQLQTSTLPVVVISNVCQASAAWASILWFNLLSPDPKDQLFFQAPPPAPWPVLAEALSWQFMAAAGRGLDHDQLHMLAEKLFGPDASPKSTLPWIQFSKDSPPGFSFWTWLEGILELIHKHLASLWKDGLILGFVSKKRERQLLRRRQTGTFLLRFSESCREGGITFTWVEHGSSDRPEFCSVEPYTKLELESLPLADIIRDYHMLAHKNVPESPLKLLYPMQPRDEAFGPYYSDSRKVDLLAQRKYLNRRLIPVSSRQVDDSPGQTEEGAAAAPVPDPVVKLEPRDGADLVLGPEDLELIEGLSLEPGAMEQLEESLALAGILPDVLQRGTDPYMPIPDDGVLLEPGSPESQFAEAGDMPLLQVDSRDFQ